MRKALPRRDEDEGFAEDHADVALEHQPPPTDAIPLALLKAALEELDLACEGGGGEGGSSNGPVKAAAAAAAAPGELSGDATGADEATATAATADAAAPITKPPTTANDATAATTTATNAAPPTLSDASHYAAAYRYRGLALLGLSRDAEAAGALEASLAWSRRGAGQGRSSSSRNGSGSGSSPTPRNLAAELTLSGENGRSSGAASPPLAPPLAPPAVGHVGAWLALAAAYARQQRSAPSVACLRAAAAHHAPASDPQAWEALLATQLHDPRRR